MHFLYLRHVLGKALNIYLDSYKGISKPVWILAAIQLINRSGSMVLPFMTVYMTASLGYSTVQAGIIMSVYGFGGLAGSYLGGKYSDKLGPFPVQLNSLIIGGLSYIMLPLLTGFYALACGIFLCAAINDAMRPAASSMTGHFATAETTTRSFSLMRMAINLGVSIGPAVAGMLAGIDYFWLFFGDGITCIAAGIVFYFYFRNKKPQIHKEEKVKGEKVPSPYTEPSFVFFLFLCFCYAAAFFQIFSSIPLYYKDVYLQPEQTIGLLIGFNGVIVFVFEMITVSQIEKRFKPVHLIMAGSLMLGISFIIFNVFTGMWVLLLAMILLSFSEIFAMPFMISHVVKTATPQTRGAHLAAYSIAWSIAFIVSPYCSTQIIDKMGYDTLWWVFGTFCILMALGFTRVSAIRSNDA